MDPIAVFAVPALGAAFNLLTDLSRTAVTRWRAGRRNDPISLPETTELRGALGPLAMNPSTATELVPAIAECLERLDPERYRRFPDLIRLDDPVLIETLSQLRDSLEQLFGQRITFADETDREKSGSRVEVRQDLGTVGARSNITGFEGNVKGSQLKVDQQADGIGEDSTIIGFKGEIS